jgi:hypothetical protein
MLVVPVRTDLGSIYINDIENRAQRNFSSEPAGQSLYVSKATDAELQGVIESHGYVAIVGTNTSANVNTSGGANVLVISDTAGASGTSITVTSGAAVSKATIAADLNAGFTSNNLKLFAHVVSNKICIETTGANKGVSACIAIDSSSTLETVLGLSTSVVATVTLSTLKSTIYPDVGEANVSSAQIATIAQFAGLRTATLDSLTEAVQAVAAYNLVETGPVMLSFVYGTLSKLSSASFLPGSQAGVANTHVSLPAGAAVVCLENDGSTVYSV